LARRLRSEALTAAQPQHPGITVVHDIGGHEGGSYLVMELLDGQNLSQVLDGQLVIIWDLAECDAIDRWGSF
jgi:hypothetical protein